MGITILYGALIILFNLLADLCYAWIDPRVRLNERAHGSGARPCSVCATILAL